jgi:hypothetical protein
MAYANRGIVKLYLGNKQGAIIDPSKSAELFREQGQIDLYQKVMSSLEKIKRE